MTYADNALNLVRRMEGQEYDGTPFKSLLTAIVNTQHLYDFQSDGFGYFIEQRIAERGVEKNAEEYSEDGVWQDLFEPLNHQRIMQLYKCVAHKHLDKVLLGNALGTKDGPRELNTRIVDEFIKKETDTTKDQILNCFYPEGDAALRDEFTKFVDEESKKNLPEDADFIEHFNSCLNVIKGTQTKGDYKYESLESAVANVEETLAMVDVQWHEIQSNREVLPLGKLEAKVAVRLSELRNAAQGQSR